MPRLFSFEGKTYSLPDDATDQEALDFVSSQTGNSSGAPPAASAPSSVWDRIKSYVSGQDPAVAPTAADWAAHNARVQAGQQIGTGTFKGPLPPDPNATRPMTSIAADLVENSTAPYMYLGVPTSAAAILPTLAAGGTALATGYGMRKAGEALGLDEGTTRLVSDAASLLPGMAMGAAADSPKVRAFVAGASKALPRALTLPGIIAASRGSISPSELYAAIPSIPNVISSGRAAAAGQPWAGPVVKGLLETRPTVPRGAPGWADIQPTPAAVPPPVQPIPQVQTPQGRVAGGIQNQVPPRQAVQRGAPGWQSLPDTAPAQAADFTPIPQTETLTGRKVGGIQNQAPLPEVAQVPYSQKFLEDIAAGGDYKKPFAKLDPDQRANVIASAEALLKNGYQLTPEQTNPRFKAPAAGLLEDNPVTAPEKTGLLDVGAPAPDSDEALWKMLGSEKNQQSINRFNRTKTIGDYLKSPDFRNLPPKARPKGALPTDAEWDAINAAAYEWGVRNGYPVPDNPYKRSRSGSGTNDLILKWAGLAQ